MTDLAPADGIFIRLARDVDRRRWNDFLRARHLASPLALFEWRDVLAATYGPTMRFWLAERQGEIVGVLPTYMSKGRRRPMLYSMRHGLVAVDDRVATALLQTAKREAELLGCRGAQLTSGLTVHETPFRLERKKTVVLDLSEGEPGLWKSLRRKTRPIVKKGDKFGLVADWASLDVDAFFEIYADDMADKGVPILDRHFFRTVLELLAPHTRLLTVRKDDAVVSGGVVFVLGKFATYVYQGTRPDTREFAPSTFMFWEVAKRCIAEGVTTLDLGESRDASPVFKFKINFGGSPQDLAYYDVNSRTADPANAVEAPSPPDSPRAPAWRDRVLSRLPLAAKRELAQIARARGRIV